MSGEDTLAEVATELDRVRDERDALAARLKLVEAALGECLWALFSVRNTDDHADAEVRAEVRAALRHRALLDGGGA